LSATAAAEEEEEEEEEAEEKWECEVHGLVRWCWRKKFPFRVL
jgi:hypothetical protein